MADPISNPPTLAGYIAWSRVVMGLPTTAISDNDPGYVYSFQIAQDVVPDELNSAVPDIYTLTVYNWAGSTLLQFQQDYPGQTVFTAARQAYGINNFAAGVVRSEEHTSELQSH